MESGILRVQIISAEKEYAAELSLRRMLSRLHEIVDEGSLDLEAADFILSVGAGSGVGP